MPSTSNDHGRAFECMLVDCLLHDFLNLNQTENCIRCQLRDREKIAALSTDIRHDMLNGSQIISNWIISILNTHTTYEIDRLDDTAAMVGDVTDICIYNNQQHKRYNFSVKYNHNATKHQRIPALMQALGFEKNSREDILYRQRYENIKNNILAEIAHSFPGAEQYSEIKSQNPTYIDEKIYFPLCTFYKNSINDNLNRETLQNLFKFLVGNVGFYKCINFPRYVEIMDFTNISIPTECRIYLNNNSHIRIEFNNGFILDMRLHTASSSFSGLSLKFDTQILEYPESMEKIIYNK